MLDQYKYTYTYISKELRRTEGAIKRRLLDLGLKQRPLRRKARLCKEHEINIALDMFKSGYDYKCQV